MAQKDVKNRIASVKNIQKITRAMEMVAAARLRQAEQRIEALRPYAGAIRRMTRQAAEAARRHPAAADPQEHESEQTRRASCSSPATAASPARSTRRSSAPASARGNAHEGEGKSVALLRVRAPRRVVADVPRPAARRAPTPGFTDRPSYARRARDRLGPDRRLRRRRGRPRGDLLQPLHLAADAEGDARDAASAPAGVDPRRATRRKTSTSATADGRRRGSLSGALVEYEPDPEEILSGSCRPTSRSRSTAPCSSRPRPSTARA